MLNLGYKCKELWWLDESYVEFHADAAMSYLESQNINLQHQLEVKDKVIDEAIGLIREKTKVIPFDETGEGGGLELCDYEIAKLLEILEGCKNGK